MKINVLGSDYEMDVKHVEEDSMLENVDGYCNNYAKQIVIRDKSQMIPGDSNQDAKRLRMEHVKRHELVHAFLFESGLDDYSADETLVDWIAIQVPKMLVAFREAEQLT